MDPTTIRLPDDLRDDLETEANARGEPLSAYIRTILEARDDLGFITANTSPNTSSEYEPNTSPNTDERMAELIERVEDLEAEVQPSDDPPNDERRPANPPEIEETTEDDHDPIDDIIDGWRPAQSIDRREEFRDAGRACLEWLRDREVASAAEFKAHVYPDTPVSDTSKRSWWAKNREALNKAKEIGLCEYHHGRGEWVWTDT